MSQVASRPATPRRHRQRAPEASPATRLDLLHRAIALGSRGAATVPIGGTGVFVFSLAAVREVLVEQADAFEKSDFQMKVMGTADHLGDGVAFGNGLLTSRNDMHAAQASLLGAAFDAEHVARAWRASVERATALQGAWKDRREVEIGWEMMRLSTRVVDDTLFSGDFRRFERFEGEVARLIQSVTGTLGASARPAMRRRASLAIRRMAAVIEEVIERRAARRDGNPSDVLGILLAARRSGRFRTGSYVLSDAQVRDETTTLLFTGVENPRNVLSWTWYLLTRHPDVYARVREEAAACDLASEAARKRLPYTTQVLKEVLRLYPAGYAFGRRATRRVRIGGATLEPGMHAVVSPYVLHRSAAHFPNPESFDPERFSEERIDSIPRLAFLPFGAGPRACIGGQMSMAECLAVIAAVAKQVVLHRPPGAGDVLPDPRITLRPAGPISLRVERTGRA